MAIRCKVLPAYFGGQSDHMQQVFDNFIHRLVLHVAAQDGSCTGCALRQGGGGRLSSLPEEEEKDSHRPCNPFLAWNSAGCCQPSGKSAHVPCACAVVLLVSGRGPVTG